MPPDNSPLPKLGIVAGAGDLPGKLIEACRSSGRPFFVLAIKGHADHPAVDEAPHTWLRLGRAGSAETVLRREGVEEVVFAGGVKRPSMRELVPDLKTAKVLLKATRQGLGDDGLLGLVIEEFEAAGVRVVGAHTILPELLAPEGPLGRRTPDETAEADIKRGVEVVRGLGALDIGQSCVVQQGIVLGVEAIEGTDALLRRVGELKRRGPGGVLVKMKKPGQDERIDLPTVGTQTVQEAQAAGLRGIAIEAQGTIVLEREEVARAADDAGLFVVGLP